MRIVAGSWRGRRLVAPKGTETRPTSDRVREGIFGALSSLLGPDLGGAVVLDLFSGTGALGLEALSRGASRVVAVERDRAALTAIGHNIETLGAADRIEVVAGDALGAGLARAATRGPYSLLLSDPPYRIEPATIAAVIEGLAAQGALEDGAVVVVEHAAGTSAVVPEGTHVLRTYSYGSTSVTVMRVGGTGVGL